MQPSEIDNDWIIAVGADGVIAASDNLGEDWRWFQMDEKYDLNDFVILNEDRARPLSIFCLWTASPTASRRTP